MTRTVRAALRLVAAVIFAVTLALSVWLLSRPPEGRAADCATAQAMRTYNQSQLAPKRSAALASDADNSRSTLAYQNMVDQLQSFADRITTPDIRAKADTVVAINRDMFDHWKRWLAESQSDSTVSGVPTDSDRLYVHEFTEEARKLKIVDAELEKACPA